MNLFFMNSIGVESWGGGEKWMLTVACGLRERGHRVYFCGRTGSLFLERGAEINFPILPLNIKGDFGLRNILKLAFFFKNHHIDIVVANFNKDVRLAGIARHLSGVPLLIARNGLPILQNNWRYRLSYKHLVDKIITNTEAIKNRYLTYGWMGEDFIRVIRNGISTNHTIEFPLREIYKKHQLKIGVPLVSIFGRLVKQKQHTIFLEVARNILKELPTTNFLIVGDGPLRDDLKKYAFDLGILDSIYFLGRQPQVMELYSISDVVLLTSETEGLPNVVMEAMLAGKPVVAFDVGGVSELIIPDKTGILVPPNDIFLMAQRTLELLTSYEIRRRIGSAARHHILRNFSFEKMLDEIEGYLEVQLQEKKGEIHGT